MKIEPMSESGKRLLAELKKSEDDKKIALQKTLQEKRMKIFVLKTEEGSKFNVGDEVFFGNETVAINVTNEGKTVMVVSEKDIVARIPAETKAKKK